MAMTSIGRIIDIIQKIMAAAMSAIATEKKFLALGNLSKNQNDGNSQKHVFHFFFNLTCMGFSCLDIQPTS